MNAPGRPRGECRTAEPEGGPVAALAEDPVAAVQAWRGRATAIPDPVRWCVIEALARRAAAQQGEARQLLARRIAQLLDECPAAPATPPAPLRTAPGRLAELLERLGAARPAAAPRAAAPGALKAVTAFHGTWSRLRADRRLREALAQVPAQAGPLNSAHVVHRALQELRRLSPAYLEAFMAHVDTLLWLEQASGVAPLPAPRRPASGRPAGR